MLENQHLTRPVVSLTSFELFAPSALRLHDGGNIAAEVPPRMSGDPDGWTVAMFHVETNDDVHSDHWEIHPAGEEAVCVLAGCARLTLRPADDTQDEEAVTLTAGTACLVPRGRWHRLEVDGPTDLMSITPRRGSRLEKRAVTQP